MERKHTANRHQDKERHFRRQILLKHERKSQMFRESVRRARFSCCLEAIDPCV